MVDIAVPPGAPFRGLDQRVDLFQNGIRPGTGDILEHARPMRRDRLRSPANGVEPTMRVPIIPMPKIRFRRLRRIVPKLLDGLLDGIGPSRLEVRRAWLWRQ